MGDTCAQSAAIDRPLTQQGWEIARNYAELLRCGRVTTPAIGRMREFAESDGLRVRAESEVFGGGEFELTCVELARPNGERYPWFDDDGSALTGTMLLVESDWGEVLTAARKGAPTRNG